jgi:hypothetical protein
LIERPQHGHGTDSERKPTNEFRRSQTRHFVAAYKRLQEDALASEDEPEQVVVGQAKVDDCVVGCVVVVNVLQVDGYDFGR